MTLQEVLTNGDSFATTLLVALIDRYGTDCIEWDPLTLKLQIKEDLGLEITDSINDRIQAACALLQSDLFFLDFAAFNNTCNSFSFTKVSENYLYPADIDNCAWGCVEAKMLLGEDYNPEAFSPEIASYVGLLLEDEGIYKPPSMLAFALYSETTGQRTQDAFVGDEIMFQLFWEEQQAKKDELEYATQERLLAVFNQLKSLKLKTKTNRLFLDSVISALSNMETA